MIDLDAIRKRIADFFDDNNDDWLESLDEIATIDAPALIAEVERLRKALEPFAPEKDWLDEKGENIVFNYLRAVGGPSDKELDGFDLELWNEIVDALRGVYEQGKQEGFKNGKRDTGLI